MKHKRIILTGMMGSGKTTIGKELSKKLKLPFFELDEIFEKENNITIKDYFKKFSQEDFRIKESQILLRILNNKEFVISTGGGVILNDKNRKVIFSQNIFSIYLKANKEEIYNRLKNDNTRPLLLVSNPEEEIEKILNQREKFYEKADITIDTNCKTVDEITKEIELAWKKLQ